MRRSRTFLVGLAVTAALVTGALFGGIITEAGSAPATAPAPPNSMIADQALAGIGGAGTAATVERLEQAIVARPGDANALAALGLAYQLRWRETGDASFLPRAERSLARALIERPDDPTAVLGLGSLALSQHQFRLALRLGRQAARLAPASAKPLGVVGTALLELGRYGEAFRTFDRMTALKPNLASYARISYARELAGDPEGAIAAMRLALDAAGGVPEPTAWAHVEAAKLELGLGRLDRAARHLSAALTALPGYVYAREQLARVEAARGRLDSAIREARRASDAIPLPQFLALLEELLDRRGRPEAARRQRATVAVIQRLLRANGVRIDLEAAVYRADRRIDPEGTVVLARRAQEDRPSIYGDDALAWALARAGRCAEAVTWAERSLRLGTKDALLYFHRGYAAGCAGDSRGMRAWYQKALALGPAFSVRWAPVARRVVDGPNQ